jgi:hypothetical protein
MQEYIQVCCDLFQKCALDDPFFTITPRQFDIRPDESIEVILEGSDARLASVFIF